MAEGGEVFIFDSSFGQQLRQDEIERCDLRAESARREAEDDSLAVFRLPLAVGSFAVRRLPFAVRFHG